MNQFSIAFFFIFFSVFFLVGYFSKKKSGGFFLMFAGFTFIAFDIEASSVLGTMVSAFISPFGIFIILLGIMKAFFTDLTKEGATDKE